MATTINLHLLDNKNIITDIDGIPLSQENSYKIIAGESGATIFKIVDKPEQYVNAQYTIEMLNSQSGGIKEAILDSDTFSLPVGMAVAGYAYILLRAYPNKDFDPLLDEQLDTTVVVPFTVLKIKVWNTLPEWKNAISDWYMAKIENGHLFIKTDGVWIDVGEVSGADIVQTTGESTTTVMSQKAVTDELAKINAKLFVTPTITLRSGGTGASSYPYRYTQDVMYHYETNTEYISGNLTLTGSGISSPITVTPSETQTYISFAYTNSNVTSPLSWTLSGKDTKGNTISKTIYVTGWWTCYYGASSNTEVSDTLIGGLSSTPSLTGINKITVTTTAGQYVWFITTSKINKVTSSGFEVPITLVNDSYSYNSGTYKCYRTTSALTAGTHTFVVS